MTDEEQDNYAAWIAEYLGRFRIPEACLGRCQEAVTEMHRAFPELTIVKGHVHCAAPWGKRGHWWLTTADGAIIDPTRAQFNSTIVWAYEPYVEGDDVRLGACMECGASIWGPPDSGHPYFCSRKCEGAFEL